MSERSIGVTLLGLGVVGGGVVNILTQQRDLLRQRTGLTFDIRHVVVRDLGKHAATTAQTTGRPLPLTTDAQAAIDDPRTQVVIELIGGTTDAASHIERALRLGKPVVTANKSLLSARCGELFALARKHDTCIAFEGSCGGGVPIVDSLMKGLLANRIDALVGIVNGTCNVILTRMTRNGWSYDQALTEAQRLGFAEADPTLDVSGRDAAQKLALLASLAFNVGVSESDIHVEGINTIQPVDIGFASDLGYVIKLLAIAERESGFGVRVSGIGEDKDAASSPCRPGSDTRNSQPDSLSSAKPDTRNPQPDSLSLRVHPTLVHNNDVLAEVSGSFNAISVYGHALGHALFYGRGAGQMPTASAVVSDLIGVALGTIPLAFKQLRIFPDTTPRASVLPFHELQSRYYLRLMVKDQPGVMGQVSQILGNNGISLSAILQRETDDGQNVPIVITTHRATEGPMRKALDQINALPAITPPAVCLRIIDQPKEFAGG